MNNTSLLGIRTVLDSDCWDIYSWRNHLSARKYSKQTTIIKENVHENWFKSAILDPNRCLYIGLCGEKKIGVVRFDKIDPNIWKVNIIVNNEQYGRGFGTLLLHLALDEFVRIKSPLQIYADIHNKNIASVALFTKIGFKKFLKDSCDLGYDLYQFF